jgi:hypothetical protein
MLPNAATPDKEPPWWASMVPDSATKLPLDDDAAPPALELRQPHPALPPLQADAAGGGAPPSKSPWARYRLCGYSGSCCCVIAIVVVCCVLLLAAAAYYYYLAMRARAFLTVTVEVPATSLSSNLGASLKCDFAATLAYAQPPINFNDIALDSFALTDPGASEVQISPADVSAHRLPPFCAQQAIGAPSPSLTPHPTPPPPSLQPMNAFNQSACPAK